MTAPNLPSGWVVRLVRVAALLNVVAAVTAYVTPVNAGGKNLVPVGCGSPASHPSDELTSFICGDLVSNARTHAIAFLVAAALLLLLSEVVLARVPGAWLRGLAVAATVAVPLLALSIATLLSTVAGSAADGSLIRCGTPLAQATDDISRLMCGQLADRARSLGLAGVVAALVALAGGAAITREHGDRADADEKAGGTTSDDGAAR